MNERERRQRERNRANQDEGDIARYERYRYGGGDRATPQYNDIGSNWSIEQLINDPLDVLYDPDEDEITTEAVTSFTEGESVQEDGGKRDGSRVPQSSQAKMAWEYDDFTRGDPLEDELDYETGGLSLESGQGELITANYGTQSSGIAPSEKSEADEPGILEWLLGALAGEFNSDPSASQIGTDLVVSVIPILDQVADARDILAHAYWMLFRGEYNSPGRWVSLAFTLIGIVPGVGSVIKSISKYITNGTAEAAQHIDEILAAIAPLLPDGGVAGVQRALASNWDDWASSGKQSWVNSIQRLRGAINDLPGFPRFRRVKQDALAQLDELLAVSGEMLDSAFAEARRRLDEILEQLGIRRQQQLAMATERGGNVPSRMETEPPLRGNEPSRMQGNSNSSGNPSEPVRQNSSNLDELYQQASEAQEYLSQATEEIANRLGGKPLIPPTLKGRERTLEKITADYGGDASRITDLARSSIIFNNPEQVYRALEVLQNQFNVARIKDRFQNPANGYRDILLNLEMPNGHVVEMQLHLRSILEVKNGIGHELYEKVRGIKALAQTENRPLTRLEIEQIRESELEMERLYERAFQQSLDN